MVRLNQTILVFLGLAVPPRLVGDSVEEAKAERAKLGGLVHDANAIGSPSIAFGTDASGFDPDGRLLEIPVMAPSPRIGARSDQPARSLRGEPCAARGARDPSPRRSLAAGGLTL